MTVLFQSFRTRNVPSWIRRCLDSGRAFAGSRGFAYRFFDDALLDLVPEDYRRRTERHLCAVTDLGRLIAARNLLDEGYERAVWLDADVLVFAPERVELPEDAPYAFCHEIWTHGTPARVRYTPIVNNAVCTFARGNAILDFLIDAFQTMVRRKPGPLDRCDAGPNFFTPLHRRLHFPLVRGVGMMSPLLMEAIALDENPHVVAGYARATGTPIGAANIGGSMEGRVGAVLGQVVERLADTRGEIVNRWLSGAPEP